MASLALCDPARGTRHDAVRAVIHPCWSYSVLVFVEAGAGRRHGFREVAGKRRTGRGAQEPGPGGGGRRRAWAGPGLLRYLPHCVGGSVDPGTEFAVDAADYGCYYFALSVFAMLCRILGSGRLLFIGVFECVR
jgi:hypothetical protein